MKRSCLKFSMMNIIISHIKNNPCTNVYIKKTTKNSKWILILYLIDFRHKICDENDAQRSRLKVNVFFKSVRSHFRNFDKYYIILRSVRDGGVRIVFCLFANPFLKIMADTVSINCANSHRFWIIVVRFSSRGGGPPPRTRKYRKGKG